MNRPWMPFYVADYLADTGHLSTTQHGAYILLICHYWRTGGLPDDDVKLAKITRLSLKSWNDFVRPDLVLLFREGWRHKRIDQEIEKQEIIAVKRAMAGHKGGSVTASARAIAKAVSLSNHASTKANARQVPATIKQMPSKRVAVTLTKITNSESVAAREGDADAPQEAIDEVKKPPAPSETTRSEYDEMLERRRSA